MSAFTSALVIQEVSPGRVWRLCNALIYEAGAKGSRRVVCIPSGFETDGATLPPVLRLVMAVWGTYGRAAALHDYLYQLLRQSTPHPHVPTRRAADAEFLKAMRACGTGRFLALLMWASVRLFGASCAKPDAQS